MKLTTMLVWTMVGVMAGLMAYSCSVSARAQTPTLQAMIDSAVPGSVLRVPAGIYREAVRVTRPLTVDGQGQAEIRGSDVFTSWQQIGSTWQSTQTVPVFQPAGSEVYVDQFQATRYEQVWLDTVELVQVPQNPADGQFAVDSSRRIVLGSNPAGKLAEVTVRDSWILPEADDVTVQGFTMKHAATFAQGRAVGNHDRAGFTLRDSIASNAHGTAVGIGGGDVRTSLIGNTIRDNGNLGIAGYLAGHPVIRGNTIQGNGNGGWDWGWQGGGAKIVTSSDVLIEDNIVLDNNGPGIWCDIACERVEIRNNRVVNHSGPGVFFEVSTGARITGNTLHRNGAEIGPGLYISSSGSAEVDNNVVYDSPRGIQLYADNRPDAQPLTQNYVHDNSVIMAGAGFSLMAADYGSGQAAAPASNNRGSNNRVWYPTPEMAGDNRYWWPPNQYWDIAGFAQTPLGQGARYLSTAEKDVLLSAPATPTATLTPVPSATPTLTATATLAPATRTPVPCEVAGWRNGTPVRIPRAASFCNGAIPVSP